MDIIYIANNAFELGYNVMKGTEYFVFINSVVITEDCNVTVDSEESVSWCHRISDTVNEVSHKSMSF
jgi:hypothetical protein